MEELTGLKWDAARYEKFKGIVEESNRAYELLTQLGNLRKQVPCVLPGRMLVLNEIVAPLAGTPEVTSMLQNQLDMEK